MSWNEKQDYFVSWDELQRAARELARLQLPATQWRGIIAVSRGGLVPAAILARELNLKQVETICVSSYDHQDQREQVELIKDAAVSEDGEGFLVVDDLVDSGNTFRYLRTRFPKAKFVTIYAKPKGAALVDNYVIDVAQERWIHFPWDMIAQYETPLAGE